MNSSEYFFFHDRIHLACQVMNHFIKLLFNEFNRCIFVCLTPGAWGAVKACCAFCECGACCPCGIRDYMLHDAERKARRHSDMREFDARVKIDHQIMRIMYDKE